MTVFYLNRKRISYHQHGRYPFSVSTMDGYTSYHLTLKLAIIMARDGKLIQGRKYSYMANYAAELQRIGELFRIHNLPRLYARNPI